MTSKWTLAASAAAIALAGGFATAQETTGSIRGYVTDDAGAPLSGALVTVTDAATGTSRSTRTTGEGLFSIRNLSVAGNYTVTASSAGFESERVENIGLFLGEATSLSFDLASGSTDEIVVVATAKALGADLGVGPSSVFGLETLQNAPAINRDIKDVVRIDPRVYLDESFAEAIQCAGANPRFNSLTVDGIRMNDQFGLNSNGYPTERIPFSYDAIDQVAVELAPFDVEYGQFTACNINAVTKSGTNEFHGGFFADYTNDSLRGEEAAERSGPDKIDNGDFDEYRYGLNIGGPIIKDRLFFFAAYEKQEGANLFGDNTPTGKGITDAEFQQIVDIAQNTYGYTVSDLPSSLDNEDEKLLVKLDWNISDQHRAAFTYNWNDGFNNSPSDGDGDELPEFNHFYERGAELTNYAGALYSDWTDNLSTEIRIAYQDLDNRQIPLGGLDQWGEVQINVGDSTVYLGADDSRHANKLSYELWTYKAKADYAWNNHLFTVGVEREEFEVFNLFIQEVQGEWNFDSIADFAAGQFTDFRYENAAGSNDQNDGAAEFGYEITSFYGQDEWQATDRLNIVAGLRVDLYSSDDTPAYNASFHNDFGIRNDDNLDGKSVVQPRVAFTYDWNSDFSVRGGFGLFSGGNPNVWISNNYSNNGVTLFEYRVRGGNVNDFTYAGRGPFFDVPEEGVAAVAAANGRGAVNALDPNFEIPSEWKFNLGFTYDFDGAYDWMGGGYTLIADVLYSKVNEAAIIENLDYQNAVISIAPDGRPVYSADFTEGDYFGPFDNFLLTNAENKGQALTLSAALSKSHDFGLDWTVGYAYVDAKDTNPMTSSVAFSNNVNYTTFDPLNVPTATSDYEIPHRFTLNMNYEREFFTGLDTRFTLFGQISEGSPYSYTFARNGEFEGFFSNNRQLFYVPEGSNDPLVTYADTFDGNGVLIQTAEEAKAGLLAFVSGEECMSGQRSEIVDRNSCHDDWWTKFDIKVSQDLPGLREGHSSQAFFMIENVGNLLDKDWGVLRQHGFPGAANLVDVDIQGGQYVYSNFRDDADQGNVVVDPSLWEIRFGFKYDF